MDSYDLALALLRVAIVFTVMVISVPVMVLAERKILGRIQVRPGPNRVGPWGLLQTIVDGVKLLLKEDLIPPKADKVVFMLAPVLTLVPALMTIAIVPFGPPIEIELGGATRTIPLGVTDLPVGVLFYLAVTSVGVYGIVLAGWASNSKYSLLGGVRSSAQLISYELSLGLSMVGVLMIAGSFELRDLVAVQEGGFWRWGLFMQPMGFLLFLVGGFAETNRLPFDLAEGESELGAGFHTEYSSLRFAMFFMAEYMNIFTFAAIISTLFLGGYHGPIAVEGLSPALAALSGIFWMGLKIGGVFFFFVWVRGTLPRLRYDQLMHLGWKAMFPLALLNVVATAAVFAIDPDRWRMWLLVAGAAQIALMDAIANAHKKRVLRHAA